MPGVIERRAKQLRHGRIHDQKALFVVLYSTVVSRAPAWPRASALAQARAFGAGPEAPLSPAA